jgi:hypothetical protein
VLGKNARSCDRPAREVHLDCPSLIARSDPVENGPRHACFPSASLVDQQGVLAMLDDLPVKGFDCRRATNLA